MSPLINTQIKRLYEQGATPEQICEAFPNLRPAAVEILLAGMSKDFRKELDTKEESTVFNKSQREWATEGMLALADDPDCPHAVKFKVFSRVIDEERGRLDIAKDLARSMGGVNVNLINLHIAQTEERYRAARGGKNNIIELKPEEQELLKAE